MKIGTDIVKISRIAELSEEEKRKIFQPAEMERPLQSLAGIFAAKEAIKKAMGTDIDWLDIEIKKEDDGKPTVVIKEDKHVLLSISHDGDYAMAMVIIR